jgi:hypothetical protein
MPDAVGKTLGVEPQEPEERARAIAEPGASWREFLFFELAKVWIVLGLFVLDSWIIIYWTQPLNVAALFLSLAAAIYLDFLLYRVLWYRPDPEESYLKREFRPTLIRPVRWGRWTPEAWRARDGRDPYGDAIVGPDPREFL